MSPWRFRYFTQTKFKCKMKITANGRESTLQRILVVEDSAEYCILISRTLSNATTQVVTANSCREAVAKLAEGPFQLLILDLGLPDGDGFQALFDLRSAGLPSTLPVFFLTAETDLDTKVAAFNAGADDYLTKPVNPLELRARVEMRLKKSSSSPSAGDAAALTFGPLSLDLRQMRVLLNESSGASEIPLTSKEYRILSFLAQNPDRSFSRREIVENVWGQGVHVIDRTVDSHIYGLRKKLGSASAFIVSVAGEGYLFSPVAAQKAV